VIYALEVNGFIIAGYGFELEFEKMVGNNFNGNLKAIYYGRLSPFRLPRTFWIRCKECSQ
jgi:hypothetical protein